MHRSHRVWPVLAAGVHLLAGCSWIHPSEPLRELPPGLVAPRLEEIPVEFSHRWDGRIAHHLSGASVLDIDADGREEIFVGGGEGQDDALLGLVDGRLVDRIEGTGLSARAATYGSTAIDLDDDGDVDLIVARNDGVMLYLNQGGFFEARPLPVSLPESSVVLAVAVSDVDHDGAADLYLSVFVDLPHFRSATFNVPSHAKANRLLRGDGKLGFTDVTDAVTASSQNTFTSLFVDLDGDGYQELVVAQNTGQAELLRNLGDGHFTRVALDTGYGFWMGVASGDIDGDGDQDLFFSNVGDSFPGFLARGDLHDDQRYEGGWLLLRNDGGLRFTDVTRAAGLAGMGFAWGPAFEDMNLDGRLDLLVAQNYIKWPVHRLFKFPGKVLLGEDDGFYPAAVGEDRAYGNAPVVVDLDGDCRPDLFWLNDGGPSRAYLNRSEGRDVCVRMPDSVRALGAKVRIEGANAGGPTYTREVTSGAGLGSDATPTLFFGLGGSQSASRLVIDWADGSTTILDRPGIDRPVAIIAPRFDRGRR